MMKKKNIQDSGDVNPEKKIEKTMELSTTTKRRPWEDLPHHLLELFLKPILDPMERPNLSRVCKAWAEFKPPCFPALVHGCTIFYSFIRGIDGIDEYPIKSCLGSYHGWLIIRMKKKYVQYHLRTRKDQSHLNELYYVLNIFTKEIIQLPILRNIFLSCPKICLSSVPTDPDCIALLFDDMFRGFVFSKRGGCNKWIECKYDFNSKPALVDEYYIRYSVVPLGGKFYAVGNRGELVVIDVNHHRHHPMTATATSKTSSTVLPVNGIFPTEKSRSRSFDWFMTESLGKLVVVNVYRNESDKDITNLGVFELDFETMSWITMKNLPGDQVLFIGLYSSFSISGSELGISSSSSSSSSGRGGYNCIYVSDNDKVHRYDMHNQELILCTGFPDSKVFDRYNMYWVKPTSV